MTEIRGSPGQGKNAFFLHDLKGESRIKIATRHRHIGGEKIPDQSTEEKGANVLLI